MAQMNDSVRLAMELEQIIEADRKAMEMLNDAQDTKRSIEEKTAAEKQTILKEAEEKRQEMLKKVQEEQREVLAARKKEASAEYAEARVRLQKTMDDNREKWAGEITQHILGTGKE
ncbi:hypothetical protein LJC49_06140 [Ruminococcaceae bacterium OttesenSCG-928-I18]|nr:hypothetical protein [Ruminococcaceae bacterium OttesenSCG-928-I18]